MLGDFGALSAFMAQTKTMYLYGAGDVGAAVVKYAGQHNFSARIAGILDRDYGHSINAIPVERLETLARHPQATVLITTKRKHQQEIMAALGAYGCGRIETLSEGLCEDLLRGARPVTLGDLEAYAHISGV